MLPWNPVGHRTAIAESVGGPCPVRAVAPPAGKLAPESIDEIVTFDPKIAARQKAELARLLDRTVDFPGIDDPNPLWRGAASGSGFHLGCISPSSRRRSATRNLWMWLGSGLPPPTKSRP